MKKLFKALGLSKADEMEKSIQLIAIRLTWIYTVVFLGVWSIYEIKAGTDIGRINFLPLILLVSQNAVMFLCQLIYRAGMTKGLEDEEKKSQLGKNLLIIATVVIIGAVSTALARYISS